MSNLHFEYQDSISINALTLLCNEIDQFDHHMKGIQLSNYLSIKMADSVKKTNVEGLKEINVTTDSKPEKYNPPVETELDAMQEFHKTRQQIKKQLMTKRYK